MKFNTSFINALIFLFCVALNTIQASEFDDLNPYDAQIVTASRFVCIGEDYAEIKLLSNHEISEIQWLKNDSVVSSNRLSYFYKSGFEPSSHIVRAKVTTAEGDIIYTNPLEIVEEPCCNDSNYSSKHIINIEDFGFKPALRYRCKLYGSSFNLLYSPRVASGYDTEWTYDPYIMSNKFSLWDGEGEIGSCQYIGAANVTSRNDGAIDGTQWGETAKMFNGKNPSENGFDVVPDHTSNGYDYGGMLFVNDKFDTTETVIASELITCKYIENTMLNVRFFFTTFGTSKSPTKLKLRLTDMNTNIQTESDVYVRYNDERDKTPWTEVSLSSMHASGRRTPATTMEIISVKDESNKESGNQIVIDDIEYWICSKPRPIIELSTIDSTNTIKIINEKQLQKDPNFDFCYQYQYTTTPDVDYSWKNLLPITKSGDSIVLDMEIPKLQDGDIVYYRVVGGDCAIVSTGNQIIFTNAHSKYRFSNIVSSVYHSKQSTSSKVVEIVCDFNVVTSEDGIVVTTLNNMLITIWNTAGKCMWSGEIDGTKKLCLDKGTYVISNRSKTIKTTVR